MMTLVPAFSGDRLTVVGEWAALIGIILVALVVVAVVGFYTIMLLGLGLYRLMTHQVDFFLAFVIIWGASSGAVWLIQGGRMAYGWAAAVSLVLAILFAVIGGEEMFPNSRLFKKKTPA